MMSLGGPPARRSGAWVILVLGALVVVNLYVFVWDKDTSVAAIKREAEAKTPAAALPSQPLIAPVPASPLPATPAPVGPPGVVDGKVGRGDTLGRLLKKSGLTGPEADEVIRALSGALDFKNIRAGQSFRIERGADGRVKLFELVLSKVSAVRAVRQPTGELVGKNDTSATLIETRSLGGRIETSLWHALHGAGETPALVDFFVDVFAYDLDFYNDTQVGDTFRVVVEKEHTDGPAKEFVRYKRILAAEYKGRAGTYRTYFFEGGYYNDDGESSEKTLLKTPLKFQRISSGFDRARMHPILHTATAHLGVDYAAPTGTPIWAAAGGTISFRGPAGGAGNLVVLRHDGGLETAYMHMSKFVDGQKVGQKIAAKTVIGYVGTTGLSTGPHLHFGVKKDGVYIDPSKLAPVKGKGVPARLLPAFREESSRLRALLDGVKLGPPAS
jgi:murein DD-endopeptidase MepM/ murein hydrolase activator NlpD